jgi:hypothetical protein
MGEYDLSAPRHGSGYDSRFGRTRLELGKVSWRVRPVSALCGQVARRRRARRATPGPEEGGAHMMMVAALVGARGGGEFRGCRVRGCARDDA